jgi:hypothetical protein
MKLRPFTFGLLAAAALATPPALAASTSTGVLTGWTFELIDLDTTDGIAPEMVFSNPISLSRASAQGLVADDVLVPGIFSDGFTAVNAVLGQALGATSLAGNFATGNATGDAGALVEYSAIGLAYSEFSLTAMTGVVITASFSGTAETTLGSDGVRFEFAGAVGQLSFDVLVNDVVENYNASAGAFASAVDTGSGFTGQFDSFTGVVTLSYDNLSTATRFGATSAYAYAYGGSALPVPEPQTLMLWLAGLAAVGRMSAQGRSRALIP